MSNELEKFDSASIMDNVRDRIKATFIGLIPNDVWEGMIQKEINQFFQMSDKWDPDKLTGFQKLVKGVVEEFSKQKIQEMLTTFQTGIWDNLNGCYEPTQIFKDIIIKNAPEIFASVFQGMASQVVYQMKK